MSIESEFLSASISGFREIKSVIDRGLAQVNDEQFFAALDAESNSIAVIVKHVAGNLRSRWTDFLTSDGEKADRHRDSEFEMSESATHAANHGGQIVFLAKHFAGSAWQTVSIPRHGSTAFNAAKASHGQH